MRLHFFTNYFPLKFWHYKQTLNHANLRSTIKILLVCVCTRVPYSSWWNKRNSCLLDFFDSIFFYLNTSCVSRAKKSEVQSLRETCTQVQKVSAYDPPVKHKTDALSKSFGTKRQIVPGMISIINMQAHPQHLPCERSHDMYRWTQI